MFSRSYKNCSFLTPMADKRVTSVIQIYERCLNSKPYICSTTFGRATLGASDDPNKLFLAFLFSDPDVGVHLLKNVGLIRSSRVCCTCGSQTFRCVNTYRKNGGGESHLLPHALLQRHSGTIHCFSREFHEGFVPHVRRRWLKRTRSSACGGM